MFARTTWDILRQLTTSTGQTKPVYVYQLIAENTVESKVRI